jgi:light-regulated signal transduction histidine kinase (bacteriophytochrome)
LKDSEQSLKDYANRLQESNRDLEYFAMIASHDLQAPLRKIGLFSQAISEDQNTKLSEESQDYFHRILKSVEKMQKLIGYLLDLSRINRKGQSFQKTDLSGIVKEAVRDLNGFIKETNGRVEIGNMLTAEVDADQIQSLIFNLIENGLKFHRKGVPPVIKISAEPVDENSYQINVQDNGIGIPREHFQKIFQIFQRIHREAYPGTGIGLSLVLRIVERHGGYITVESETQEGSTFKVKLPFSPSTKEQ